MKALLFSLILFFFSISISVSQTMVYPVIQGYGGVNAVPFEVEKPDPTQHYKLVVELGKRPEDLDKVGEMLDYAARMYNLHIYAGVPLENLDLAVVVYGGSTPLVLSNQEYTKRFEKENPNSALLEEMKKAGIQIIVCGQSMMKQKLLPENIYPGVKMAVSRFTATTDLMQKGYQVIVL